MIGTMKRKHKEQHLALGRSQLRHYVTVWGFLLFAVVIGAVTLTSYIGNSAQAKLNYEKLLAVDAAGGDVEKSLLELRTFIYRHMNTTIG